MKGAVIVKFDKNGDIGYRVFGDEDVRLFIVDERAPNDRVYEWTQRADLATFREIIPSGTEIGSSQDARHPAIEARIKAYEIGEAHLRPVA